MLGPLSLHARATQLLRLGFPSVFATVKPGAEEKNARVCGRFGQLFRERTCFFFKLLCHVCVPTRSAHGNPGSADFLLAKL